MGDPIIEDIPIEDVIHNIEGGLNLNTRATRVERKGTDENKIDKSKETALLIIAETILVTINRNDKRKDPTTRHLLFIDKILSALDMMMSGYVLTADNVSENTKKKIKESVDLVRVKFEKIEDHIEQPYKPDHPHGYQIMKEAEKRFNVSANKSVSTSVSKLGPLED